MSPFPIGTPTYSITLPPIDINLVGSSILTVWVIANQNAILVVAFLLFMSVWAVDLLIKFVTRRKSASISLGDEED